MTIDDLEDLQNELAEAEDRLRAARTANMRQSNN